MNDCYGYIRVSTAKQGEGVSLEAQKEAIALDSNIQISKAQYTFEVQQRLKLIEQLMSGTGHGELAGTVARWAIFFLGFSMGLNQLGVADEIIQIAVSAVLGGTALALGIAFGLGGRDRAKEVIDGLGKD